MDFYMACLVLFCGVNILIIATTNPVSHITNYPFNFYLPPDITTPDKNAFGLGI